MHPNDYVYVYHLLGFSKKNNRQATIYTNTHLYILIFFFRFTFARINVVHNDINLLIISFFLYCLSVLIPSLVNSVTNFNLAFGKFSL